MDHKTDCIISHNGDEKYILVRMNTAEGVKAAIVSMPLRYHKDIAEQYQRSLGDQERRTFRVMGGGLLAIDREARTIRTYGKSTGYGFATPSTVEKILKTHFPEFTIDATITDETRD